jgi:hypothetical protein
MRIKQEEIVPLADMLIASFERDQVEIEAENSFYSVTVLNDFKTMTNVVRELEKKDVLLTNQKRITKELYKLADDLYQPLKLFTVVVQKSGLSTTLVQDIINNLKKRNMEKSLQDIKALIQVVNSNKDLLLSKAMKPTLPALLETNFTLLTDKSNLQNKMITDRKLLTNDNQGSFDTLYNEYIIDICNIGKALYHGKAKAEEYTITKMVKRLHVTYNNNDDKGTK